MTKAQYPVVVREILSDGQWSDEDYTATDGHDLLDYLTFLQEEGSLWEVTDATGLVIDVTVVSS